MAADSTNDISYFLSVEARYQDHLGNIRDWENLKMGKEGNLLWLKGFTEEQLSAMDLQTIPYKKMYYAKGAKLFEQGSLLPCRDQPALLWTAISRSLPLRLPDFNHNYFGIDNKVSVQLSQTAVEKDAFALICPLAELGNYLQTAPAIRLQPLKWVVINQKNALILGAPLLPIKGKAFWQNRDSLLPLGYDFELSILSSSINEALNPSRNNWLLWNEQHNYTNIPKELFQALSISSYRKTIEL